MRWVRLSAIAGGLWVHTSCALMRAYDTPTSFSDQPIDQQGTLTITSPDWRIASQAEPGSHRIEATFRVGEGGIAEGGALWLSLGHLLPTEQQIYTPFSLTTASAYFFGINLLTDVSVEASSPGVRLRTRAHKPAASLREMIRYIKYKRNAGELERDNLLRQIDNDQAVRIEVRSGALEAGDELQIVIGVDGTLPAPTREARLHLIARLDADADGVFGLLPDPPAFDTYSAPPTHGALVAPATMEPGQLSRLVLRIEDDYFLPNLARFERARLRLDPVEGLVFPLRGRIQGSLGDWRGCVTEWPIGAITEGTYRLTGTLEVDGVRLPLQSNPIRVQAPDRPHVYFGDTHIHSILSYDADRPPDHVYWRQRHQERLDFAFLSDHDMIGAVPFAPKTGIQGRTEGEWAYARSLADAWHQPGEFVTLYAYEWTSYFYGHRNIYFAPDLVDPPLLHHNHPSSTGQPDELAPGELRADLAELDYIAIPHSTAWPTADEHYHWGPHPEGDPRGDPHAWPQQRLLELYSTHGASEFHDNEHAVDAGRPEAPTDSKLVRKLMSYDIQQAPPDSGNFARDALATGWRFGFLGSSDMHYLSHIDQAYRPGLAAVVADDLSRASLWEAMNARRTYAVTGARILLEFSVGGVPMGGEVSLGDSDTLSLTGSVVGTDAIDFAQIVKFDGQAYSVLHQQQGDGAQQLELSLDDDDARAGQLYYLRVRQRDGHYAWASPVWVVP